MNYIKRTGFTLLEVLIVLIIVAIIAAVAVPRFRSSHTTIQLTNTVQDIAQLMRFLRASAQANKIVYQLKFDFTGRKYFAQAQKTSSSSKKAAEFEKPRSIPRDIDILTTRNPIKFYPNGTIDEVSIYLFRGKREFYKDLEYVLTKDFDLGQIQTVTDTKNIYTIKTKPSIGRIEIVTPKEDT